MFKPTLDTISTNVYLILNTVILELNCRDSTY